MTIGERVLLPAVREAAPETVIVADGFSCREQIAQGTGRKALHIAQVLHLAMRDATSEAIPEERYAENPPVLDTKKLVWKAAGVVGGIALAAGVMALLRRWRKR
jgi:hypothetical protein